MYEIYKYVYKIPYYARANAVNELPLIKRSLFSKRHKLHASHIISMNNRVCFVNYFATNEYC